MRLAVGHLLGMETTILDDVVWSTMPEALCDLGKQLRYRSWASCTASTYRQIRLGLIRAADGILRLLECLPKKSGKLAPKLLRPVPFLNDVPVSGLRVCVYILYIRVPVHVL